MATQRIESGRVQISGPGGGVPMRQVEQPGVNYVGSQVQAQTSSALSQALDRMGAVLFEQAGRMAEREAMQFAVANEPTAAQIEAAKNGDLASLNLSDNPFGIFQQTLQKARSLQLANKFEQEGRTELVKMLNQVRMGQATSEQVQTKIDNMIKGLGTVVGRLDPDAALKFRATMATQGSTILRSALDLEYERAINQGRIKFDLDFDQNVQLLENAAIATPDQFTNLADVFQLTIARNAVTLNDPTLQKEASTKAITAIRNARIAALTRYMTETIGREKPEKMLEALREGVVGNMNVHWKHFRNVDNEALGIVEKNYLEAVKRRNEGIAATLVDSERTGNTILQRMYTTRDPGLQRRLLEELQTHPVSAETIKKARDWIDSAQATDPPYNNLAALSQITSRVAAGLATEQEIINAPLQRATKERLLAARANPGDDLKYSIDMINRAVGIQQSGMPPEIANAEARELANSTRNTLVSSLMQYATTPGDNGRLPSPEDIRRKGDALAKQAAPGMSRVFQQAADANRNQAQLSIPELRGVDLRDDAAVERALAEAIRKKASSADINNARSAIESFRANMGRVSQGGQQ
jgi:hypothetical protein